MKFAPIRIIGDSQRLYLQQIAPTIPAGFVVRIAQDRTTKQNRMQRQWCNDVAAQLGDVSAEWVRAIPSFISGCRSCAAKIQSSAPNTTRT